MSSFSYLEQLRQKPHHVRKRIIFWSAIVITVLILIIWLLLFSQFRPQQSSLRGESEQNSPFTIISDSLKGLFDDISDIRFQGL